MKNMKGAGDGTVTENGNDYGTSTIESTSNRS